MLFGLTVGAQWDVGGFELDLRGEITNLLDVGYQVIRNYPMPGRAVRVGVEVSR
jgi:outer membrane cobalamin receptor